MLTLVVTPLGLNKRADPYKPSSVDIRHSFQLISLPDKVVYQTVIGLWLIKDREVAPNELPKRIEILHNDSSDTVVVFDGSWLTVVEGPHFDTDKKRLKQLKDEFNSSIGGK